MGADGLGVCAGDDRRGLATTLGEAGEGPRAGSGYAHCRSSASNAVTTPSQTTSSWGSGITSATLPKTSTKSVCLGEAVSVPGEPPAEEAASGPALVGHRALSPFGRYSTISFSLFFLQLPIRTKPYIWDRNQAWYV